MTDRINALIVVLGKDVRDDEVESLCEAILHLRNVIKVEKNVRSIDAMIAETRVRGELTVKLLEILKTREGD